MTEGVERGDGTTDAAAVIAALDLVRHPEGGWFRETFRAATSTGARGAATAIHFLLEAGEESAWHRVDAAEVWSHTAGGPVELSMADEAGDVTRVVLGGDVLAGQSPHAVVPADVWQAARPLGDWALVCCVVAPAFEFAGFELAEGGPRDDPPSASAATTTS